jgi:four helix bundle protein
MGSFRNLEAWRLAMDLVDAVYVAVASFPASERFSLSQQMRSSAVSIPSNIAEGCGRYTMGDERRFFRNARGSSYELQTQIEIARRQHFIDEPLAMALVAQAEKVGRKINAYLNTLPKD